MQGFRPHRNGVGGAVVLLGFMLGTGCDEDRLSALDSPRQDACDSERGDCGGGDPRVSIDPEGGADGGFGPDGGPVDGGPSRPSFLDVSGTWPVQYVFDVSEYLFGVSELAGGLDFVNQALEGNLDFGTPLLNAVLGPLLEPILAELVLTPAGQRFQTVVATLNETAHLFDEIEARGEMWLNQEPPSDPTATTTRLRAEERWDDLYVRLIERCPQGRQTVSPVPFPDCANTPLPIRSVPTPIQTGNGEVDIQIFVPSFEGVLEAGRPFSRLSFEEREVELEVSKIILLSLDLAIRFASGNEFEGMQDLIQQTVCLELGRQIEEAARGTPAVQPWAQRARAYIETECVRILVQELTLGVIGEAAVDVDALRFSQAAEAIDVDRDGRSDQLDEPIEGNGILGTFRWVGQAELRGTWSAER